MKRERDIQILTSSLETYDRWNSKFRSDLETSLGQSAIESEAQLTYWETTDASSRTSDNFPVILNKSQKAGSAQRIKKKFGTRGTKFRWNRGDVNRIIGVSPNYKFEIDPKWIVIEMGNKTFRLNMDTLQWGNTPNYFDHRDEKAINKLFVNLNQKLCKLREIYQNNKQSLRLKRDIQILSQSANTYNRLMVALAKTSFYEDSENATSTFVIRYSHHKANARSNSLGSPVSSDISSIKERIRKAQENLINKLTETQEIVDRWPHITPIKSYNGESPTRYEESILNQSRIKWQSSRKKQKNPAFYATFPQTVKTPKKRTLPRGYKRYASTYSRRLSRKKYRSPRKWHPPSGLGFGSSSPRFPRRKEAAG